MFIYSAAIYLHYLLRYQYYPISLNPINHYHIITLSLSSNIINIIRSVYQQCELIYAIYLHYHLFVICSARFSLFINSTAINLQRKSFA